ncbi:MAG TPA: hypothetical protein VGX78_16585, partial [Pirellulales bacterium]|nr:hypothetical protein [Pirellulales bacterium]
RAAVLFVAALGSLTAAGCPMPGTFAHDSFGPPLPTNASAEQIVARVNSNIERLTAWRSNDVGISGQSMPVHLGGQIAVERPRNFRLTAGILNMDEEADFGSNNQWFWFWVKRANANGQPSYVYQARHEDVPNSEMLSQIPFQPDWLMEALGVVPIDAQHVTLHGDAAAGFVNLISERLSPSGQMVKKVIRVDVRRGIVVSHSLHDINGNLIAQARLEQHMRDRATGVVLPHLIALEWPQANLKIKLEIGQIEVNPTTIPPKNWEVPRKPLSPPFDIGALNRRHSQFADGRPAAANRGERVAPASAEAAGPSYSSGPPDQFGAPSPVATGRRPSAAGTTTGSWPEADGSNEWNQPMQPASVSAPGQARLPAGPLDTDAMVTASKAPAANAPQSAAADNPFSDPPPAASVTPTPARPPGTPTPTSPGTNSGNPFD